MLVGDKTGFSLSDIWIFAKISSWGLKNFADVIFGITRRNFSNLSCMISAIYSRSNRSSNATFRFSYFEGLINRPRETNTTLLTYAPVAVCATARICPSRQPACCPMTFWYFLWYLWLFSGVFIISNRNHGLFYYRTFPMILISSLPTLWILGQPYIPNYHHCLGLHHICLFMLLNMKPMTGDF